MEQQHLSNELSIELGERVLKHRYRFHNLFYNRYLEMLPLLIHYKNVKQTSIDPLLLEVCLRNNYNVVIGEAKNGKHMILGYTQNYQSATEKNFFKYFRNLQKNDIYFTCANNLIPTTIREITYDDDCLTGNVVVLKNKVLNYVNDLEILHHYTTELAEIITSRFSLSMQAKIMTFFVSDVGDETVNQLVANLYNGQPFTKIAKTFDLDEQMKTFDGGAISSNLPELKREYQNKISELNNMIGINSLAVDKESGVSDSEANSNRAFTSGNSNIYVGSRQEPLDRYNKRFGLQLEAVYDDEVSSQIQQIGDVVSNE